MKIKPSDVAYVAELAHLEIPPEEQEAFAVELSRIVEYVEQLERLDTDDTEPTSHVVTTGVHEGREDRVGVRTGSSEAGQDPGLFKVPRVIGER